MRLTQHVLFALRRAHQDAVRELDLARDSLQRAEATVQVAHQKYLLALAAEGELATVLEAHREAVNAPYADACPQCGMGGGRHTGGCPTRNQEG